MPKAVKARRKPGVQERRKQSSNYTAKMLGLGGMVWRNVDPLGYTSAKSGLYGILI